MCTNLSITDHEFNNKFWNYFLAVSPILSSEDFQPLSEKEEQDLELLMEECGFAAKDAKAFTDLLANQLMALDGVSN